MYNPAYMAGNGKEDGSHYRPDLTDLKGAFILPPRSEYESPLSYEIRNTDFMWQSVQETDGLPQDNHIGPPLNALGHKPFRAIIINKYFIVYSFANSSFRGGQLDFSKIDNQAIDKILLLLKKYLGASFHPISEPHLDRLTVKGGNKGEDGTLTLTPEDELHYDYTKSGRITSQEELNFELEKALRIYQVLMTELYAANGIQIPEETIIIDKPKHSRKKYEAPKASKQDLEDIDAIRGEIVVEEAPDVSFDNVGGQPRAVAEAKDLAEQLANPEVFEGWGVTPPRGILFYGPPGNGKTLLAKALAHEADAVFLNVNVANITSKWFGESERRVKQIFIVARQEAESGGRHAILFLDEIDSIMESRDKGNGENVQRRIIGMILQEIDGLKSDGNITVIASTNTHNALDKAFLSRMTKWIEVPNPDAQGVEEIMKIHFSHAEEKSGKKLLLPSVDIQLLAKELEGKASGRDIADIVQVALTNMAKKQLRGEKSAPITTADIIDAVVSLGKFPDVFKK